MLIPHASTGAIRGQSNRSPAGHARHADPESGVARAAARMGHCAAHPAVLAGRSAGESGVALSGAAPAGAPRLDRLGVGRLRQQPALEVLPVDARRPHRTRARTGRLGTVHGRGPARHAVELGDLMRMLSEIRARWRGIARRTKLEQELDAELLDHLEREIEARIARGMPAADARRTALVDFGGTAAHKDDIRRSLGVQLWDDLTSDLRYALRSLRREPGFALVVILTLALGIGATMTIFSAIEAVLLRPLPYPNQDELVDLRQQNTTRPGERDDVAPANFVDWRERAADALTIAAAEPYSRTYSTTEGPERVPTWLVTEGFFDILGARPLLGRTFTPGDFAPGRNRVLVLGHGIWTRKFGADPSVIGRSVVMDKEPYTIVGVMRPGFDFPRGRDVWNPKVFDAAELAARTTSYYRVVGRLRPGVAIRSEERRVGKGGSVRRGACSHKVQQARQ